MSELMLSTVCLSTLCTMTGLQLYFKYSWSTVLCSGFIILNLIKMKFANNINPKWVREGERQESQES